MNGTVAIVAGLVLAVIVTIVAWLNGRKAVTSDYLKNVSVSRQWLMQHQGEDRS